MDVKYYKGSDVEPNIFGLQDFGNLEWTLLRDFQQGWVHAFLPSLEPIPNLRGLRLNLLEVEGEFCFIFL
jgi:hypothetical protein